MADLALDVQSVPTTPAAGVSVEYVDSTTKTWRSKDDAGTVHHYLDAASAGVTGVLKGNGTGAVTAIAIPSDATKFLDGTGVFSTPSAGGTVDNSVMGFRLTLTSGSPAPAGDVTGATTVYCSPYRGNRIALYDGAAWNVRTSAEFSLAVGTLTSGLPYDVFCYDNAGTPTLEFLAWTNGTTRATALALQDGVLSKTGALTRRYLGTFYTTATTTTEDSLLKRNLWNFYNRVRRPVARFETNNTWAYTINTWRRANNSASNQIEAVIGVAEALVDVTVTATFANGTADTASVAIGVDSTSAPTTGNQTIGVAWGGTGTAGTASARYAATPAIGWHTFVWLEITQAVGTQNWYANGTLTAGSAAWSGITGLIEN